MEALILYFVLFFPGVYTSTHPVGEIIPFSMLREISRTITYSLPSLALLWYLITDKKGFSSVKEIRPGKPDFLSFAAGLPALIVISLIVSFLAYHLSAYFGINTPPKVEGPSGVQGFVVLFFSCLGTGYLEESYFRYYLLTRLEKSVSKTALRVLISAFLFSLCHIYEGPWGILNAVLAGIFLSVIFNKYRSVHGIAWAHGIYNLFVYTMNLG